MGKFIDNQGRSVVYKGGSAVEHTGSTSPPPVLSNVHFSIDEDTATADPILRLNVTVDSGGAAVTHVYLTVPEAEGQIGREPGQTFTFDATAPGAYAFEVKEGVWLEGEAAVVNAATADQDGVGALSPDYPVSYDPVSVTPPAEVTGWAVSIPSTGVLRIAVNTAPDWGDTTADHYDVIFGGVRQTLASGAATGNRDFPLTLPVGTHSVQLIAVGLDGDGDPVEGPVSTKSITVQQGNLPNTPPALTKDQFRIDLEYDPVDWGDGNGPGYHPVVCVQLLTDPPLAPARLYLKIEGSTAAFPGDGGYHWCEPWPDPDFSDPDSEHYQKYIRLTYNGQRRGWLDISTRYGLTESYRLRYSFDAPADPQNPAEPVDAATATYSPDSAVSDPVTMVAPENYGDPGEPPPPPPPPPPQGNTSAIRSLPVLVKAERDAGIVPSDHTQYLPAWTRGWSAGQGDHVYHGQDMGGIRVSKNGGKRWYMLKQRGLGTRYITSLACDPKNSMRLLATCQARGNPTAKPYQGTYLSVDGGINFERVIAADQLGEPRYALSLIDFARSTMGSSQTSRVAVAHIDAYGKTNKGFTASTSIDHGLWVSNGAGAKGTWTKVRGLPRGTYGGGDSSGPRGIAFDPSNANKLYMWGNKGLIRFEDVTNPNGAVTTLSGSGGLPNGTIAQSKIYISSNGQTLVLAVNGNGVWRSTNGGGNWSRIYAWAGIRGVAVSPADPNYMTAFGDNADDQCRVTKNAFASAPTEPYVEPATLGDPDHNAWSTHITREYCTVMYHPTDRNKAVAHAFTRNNITYDGGFNWERANDYFTGRAWQTKWSPYMFHPTNPNIFVYFMLDSGVWPTTNGGLYFEESGTSDERDKFYDNHQTCTSGAIHADGQTIIACLGRGSGGTVCRSTDRGKTWSVCTDIQPAGGKSKAYFIAFSMQTPNLCYAEGFRSTDKGANWTNIMPSGGRNIVGMMHGDGDTIYCSDHSRRIWRSTNRGTNWTLVLDASYNLRHQDDDAIIFRAHPTNQNKFYCRGSHGLVSEFTWNGSSASEKKLNPFQGAVPANHAISQFAINPAKPNQMYAYNDQDFTGQALFRSVDGGDNWDNISEGFPNSGVDGLEVSFLTDELFLSTGVMGSRVMLGPTADPENPPANSAWAKQSGWDVDYLDEPYSLAA